MNDIPESTEPKTHYLIVAAKVIFTVEDKLRERTLNVIMSTDDPLITSKTLAAIQTMIVERVIADNKVTPDQIKDIVLLGMIPCGYMTPKEFADIPPSPVASEADAAEAETPTVN